jgi:hypothetical protein
MVSGSRNKLRAGSSNAIAFSASCRQTIQHYLFHRSDRLLGSTEMRKIPSHDFARAAVDHTHQISPINCRSCPDLGPIRLPDLIRSCCFHAAHSFFRRACQAPKPDRFCARSAPSPPAPPLFLHKRIFRFSLTPVLDKNKLMLRFRRLRRDSRFVGLNVVSLRFKLRIRR